MGAILSKLQELIYPILGLAVLLTSLWGYGEWKHHEGYKERSAESAAVAAVKKKESDDAIEKNQATADIAIRTIAEYYQHEFRVLSSRPKVSGKCIPDSNPQGVPTGTCECPTPRLSDEEGLKLEERAVQDAAKLRRVRDWSLKLKLKPE